MVYDALIVETDSIDLDVFFERAPPPTFFETIQSRWPQVEVRLHEEPNKDWMEEWKKGFESFRLCEEYWVVPTWLPVPKDAKRALSIDPGMAFGTGTHATTQLAAELTVEIARKIKALGTSLGFSTLDVGTGTGILTMIAHFEGSQKTVGIDIDPEARRVARENLNHNKIYDVRIPDCTLGDIVEQFDLVIANIIDGVLLDLRPQILNVCRPKGWLVLSGIVKEREEIFQRNFFVDGKMPAGLIRKTKDEWVAYAYAPILG